MPAKTIHENPLNALIPARQRPDSTTDRLPQDSSQTQPPPKKRFTVHLPHDLIERARNAAYWTPGLTLALLAEQALREYIDKLEADQGEPFQQREHELTGGRPIK
ncbi:MAG: hypothetical protein WBG50_28700 [Desulfomonilaceae bacterium]